MDKQDTSKSLFHAKAQRPQGAYGTAHGPELFILFAARNIGGSQ